MKPIALLLLLLVVAQAPAAPALEASVHKARPGPTTSAALRDTVTELDAKLFDAVFNRCDADAVRALVADDFEFYHDKSGLAADSGKAFADSIRAMCERQQTGEDYRARRELDRPSSEVFAMNQYGALHTGVHRFFMLEPGKPEKLVEIARFSNLWKQEADGSWKLSRVFSYDHRVVE